MKQLFIFIKKEVYHITRDPLTLIIMLVLPVVLLMILGFAVSTEIKNTPFAVLDESGSAESHKLIEKISNNKYFSLDGYLNSPDEIERIFQKGSCKTVIIIPSQFSNNLLHTNNADIQLMVDASDPNEASTLVNYFQMVMMQYQQEISKGIQNARFIHAEVKMLYNPQMKSAYNFVPGLIGMIMMIICAMMTSISVVR
ncbi:MAG: ABC transporter permease, partial [Prevotella sp.]|nr:ABC transporter permease [Prevotella sp.]